jgi:hypothetical protein
LACRMKCAILQMSVKSLRQQMRQSFPSTDPDMKVTARKWLTSHAAQQEVGVYATSQVQTDLAPPISSSQKIAAIKSPEVMMRGAHGRHTHHTSSATLKGLEYRWSHLLRHRANWRLSVSAGHCLGRGCEPRYGPAVLRRVVRGRGRRRPVTDRGVIVRRHGAPLHAARAAGRAGVHVQNVHACDMTIAGAQRSGAALLAQ